MACPVFFYNVSCLLIRLLIVIAYLCVGAAVFRTLEKDSKVETSNRRPEVEQYFDWFNFAFSSTTTIGMASFKVVFPSVDNYFILIYLL